jgi:hypothetical protein
MSLFMGYFNILNGLADSGDDYAASLAASGNCSEIQRMMGVYSRLATKDKKAETKANARRLVAVYQGALAACQARAAAPSPVPPQVVVEPPPIVAPQPEPQNPVIISPGGTILPGGEGPAAPPPSVTPPAPAPAQQIAECDLAGQGMLPVQYNDAYGPMTVLAVYCPKTTQPATALQGGWF